MLGIFNVTERRDELRWLQRNAFDKVISVHECNRVGGAAFNDIRTLRRVVESTTFFVVT